MPTILKNSPQGELTYETRLYYGIPDGEVYKITDRYIFHTRQNYVCIIDRECPEEGHWWLEQFKIALKLPQIGTSLGERIIERRILHMMRLLKQL